MLRISKLTDYGIVLLTHFADRVVLGDGATHNARELAEATALPLPAVSKILKGLAQEALLVSQRGSKGGYALARAPEAIRVSEIIAALEGPIAVVECSAGPGHCDVEARCRVRDPWQRINQAIQETLERVTLADLASGIGGSLLQIDETREAGAARDR